MPAITIDRSVESSNEFFSYLTFQSTDWIPLIWSPNRVAADHQGSPAIHATLLRQKVLSCPKQWHLWRDISLVRPRKNCSQSHRWLKTCVSPPSPSQDFASSRVSPSPCSSSMTPTSRVDLPGFKLPTPSLPYEKPTPKGCDKNSMFEASFQAYGFNWVVRFSVTLQGPSSIKC